MIMKILKGIVKTVVFVVKLVVFPIKYAINKYNSKKRPRNKNDFPGVYIVSNSEGTLKIGRSKHVLRRLKSYRGYQADGKDIRKLLLIKCTKHRELEKHLH